ncbi:hypothetical protein MYAM1_002411 [Malassezia yamatoensis]|uniref:Vacuolar protein sorting-associated protein VTA1 n=1 Tax=Malassezia yamatoensis TaxID=253288 RepID=A0AAJ5YVV0_9BASI|nr:hypothetical protein MYAM1_002411 [Malassezia yamatoensis]
MDATPALKSARIYVSRADEVQKVDPIVSYWCKYYAAQLGIAEPTNDAASRAYLLSLMDDLEKTKAELGDQEAVTDDTVGHAYVENFALKIFHGADKEDQDGTATKATAKAFVAASQFLEVLNVFGALDEEVCAFVTQTEAKIKYAKWKAAQIAKSLRGSSKEDNLQQPMEAERRDPAAALSQSPTLAALPNKSEARESPMESTLQNSTLETEFSSFTNKPSRPDDLTPTPLPTPPTNEGEATHLPSTPGTLLPLSQVSPQDSAHLPSVPDENTQSRPVTIVSPSAPSVAHAPKATVNETHSSAAPSDSKLSVSDIAQVQKLSRWASSAMDYEDIDTAKTHLRAALKLLDSL